MKVVRNLLISNTEPTDTNVGWLKPLPDGNFKLFFFFFFFFIMVAGLLS